MKLSCLYVLPGLQIECNQKFALNVGEARDMNDPSNRPFLEAISRGEAPQELLGQGSIADIQVNCVRSNQDYVAPPKSVAFTGRGQTLSGQGMQLPFAV